ncbi:uncharacterized protein BX663DRAFT_442122, partial [Cokeromyces recurvatus]|uniref:uncharacterized protein n=1 Tax=Cokeromyces recurvatus TaxID=90255 RepID=UPI00221E742C
MVGEGTIGIFVNASGDAIRGTLQWSDYPQHISVDYPYTTALLGNNTIEIHNIIDQKLVQTICLDKTLKGIAPCHGIKVWISDLSERLKLHPGSKHEGESYISTGSAHTLMFSKDGVWAQIATPLAIQVDALLKENLVEEAIHLADERAHSKHITERTRTEINYVYQKCGLMLLKETLFEDAFMLMSKGKIDPRAVVQMFEGLAQPRWINESPPMSVFEGVWQFIQELGTIKEV